MSDLAQEGTQGPTLREVDPNEIPETAQRAGKASKVIEEFMQSGMRAATIEGGAKTFSVALKRYVKANELAIEVKNVNGVTYLRNATDDDE